jgi:hypothetical protein
MCNKGLDSWIGVERIRIMESISSGKSRELCGKERIKAILYPITQGRTGSRIGSLGLTD